MLDVVEEMPIGLPNIPAKAEVVAILLVIKVVGNLARDVVEHPRLIDQMLGEAGEVSERANVSILALGEGAVSRLFLVEVVAPEGKHLGGEPRGVFLDEGVNDGGGVGGVVSVVAHTGYSMHKTIEPASKNQKFFRPSSIVRYDGNRSNAIPISAVLGSTEATPVRGLTAGLPLLPLPLTPLALAPLVLERTGGGREGLTDGVNDLHLVDRFGFHKLSVSFDKFYENQLLIKFTLNMVFELLNGVFVVASIATPIAGSFSFNAVNSLLEVKDITLHLVD